MFLIKQIKEISIKYINCDLKHVIVIMVLLT